MWCPKCLSEYREGFTVCTDCGRPLVEVLPPMPEPEFVFLTKTEGDLAWQLPELLYRAGIPCYVHQGNGLFAPVTPEDAVPCALYVDQTQLDQAKACADLLAGPPQHMEEDELLEAYDTFMEQNQSEAEPAEGEEGGAAWKIFLLMAIFVLGGLLAYILLR